MEQVNLILEHMAQKYQLELQSMELQSQIAALGKQIPQALYKQRCADEKLRQYENGSLRALFHRVSGKYESQLEEYRLDSRSAANALEQLRRQQLLLESDMAQNRKELAALSDCEVQYASALQMDLPERQWVQMRGTVIKAAFYGKAALRLLEENKNVLLQARSSIKKEAPEDRLQIAYDRDQALAQADQCANACRAWIQELNDCLYVLGKEPVQLGEYFASPTSYIVGAASEWAWLDRINHALEQIATSKETLQQVQALLEEIS